MPSLITNSEKSLLTSTLSYERPQAEVMGNGVWRKRTDEEWTQNLRLNSALALSERWQLGASFSVYRRDRGNSESDSPQSAMGFGDSSLQVAYEYLSDLNYSRWLPKALVFMQTALPTGTAAGPNTDASGLNVGGRGFYSTSLGTVLLKDWGRWDVLALGEFHRNFPARGVEPGWGASLATGGGYNWRDWRGGFLLLSSYEDPLRSSAPSFTPPTASQWTTASLIVSYRVVDEWAVALSYSDQTLFGAPLNTGLSRSVSLALQRRWLR